MQNLGVQKPYKIPFFDSFGLISGKISKILEKLKNPLFSTAPEQYQSYGKTRQTQTSVRV